MSINSRGTPRTAARCARYETLTARERKTVALVAGGRVNKQIARDLANGLFHACRAQIRKSVHRPASPFDPRTCSTASTMLV